MADLEVRVVSEQRDGLLMELGRVISEHDHVLVRQRLVHDANGACLTLLMRGPDERQHALEHALGTHPRVLRLEPVHPVSLTAAAASVTVGPLRHATPPAARASNASTLAASADAAQVERMLSGLAKDYPRIFPWLINLEYAVAAEARDASLHLAGRRIGAWVFKRDFSLGAKLTLADAVRRIAHPALRALVAVESNGLELHVRGCPLCEPGASSGGRFFCGFIEGLLAESVSPRAVFARETHCHSQGAPMCVFEVSH
ncbi:hypothetical protein DVT68_05315 [Dyella solisilvae]|uniref:4-vinyl reductase 4VR domain-containing protein n=1 Tax=Dyella solisilvae TaxID=1920168 RepID=A0A370KCR4_9GAMM|nr:hypothetical protein [Dyella solisilvae]RDJ00228.1 hypothetical protein DVT68_05315 [Dyella solisilvae]